MTIANISPNSGGMAAARTLLDSATMAKNGLKLPFRVAEHGDTHACLKEAKRWRSLIYAARTDFRKRAAAMSGLDYDTRGTDLKTPYDILYVDISPDATQPGDYILTLAKADLPAFEEF